MSEKMTKDAIRNKKTQAGIKTVKSSGISPVR